MTHIIGQKEKGKYLVLRPPPPDGHNHFLEHRFGRLLTKTHAVDHLDPGV